MSSQDRDSGLFIFGMETTGQGVEADSTEWKQGIAWLEPLSPSGPKPPRSCRWRAVKSPWEASWHITIESGYDLSPIIGYQLGG
ncbi:MAG: hypothetical protein LDL33_09275 [Desulfomonile sp.]|nr:hypothetical protein [Desulfomonile sp.]